MSFAARFLTRYSGSSTRLRPDRRGHSYLHHHRVPSSRPPTMPGPLDPTDSSHSYNSLTDAGWMESTEASRGERPRRLESGRGRSCVGCPLAVNYPQAELLYLVRFVCHPVFDFAC